MKSARRNVMPWSVLYLATLVFTAVGTVFAGGGWAKEQNDVNAQSSRAAENLQRLADLPLAITSFGADRLGDALYVYGGHHGEAHHYSTAGQSGDLLRLDLTNPKKWEVVSTGPKRQGLALVAHGGWLYRIGGFEARNAQGEEHDLWSTAGFARFDPKTNKWEDLPPMPTARSSFDAVVVGDNLYVVGGWSMQGEKETEWRGDVYAFDLSRASEQETRWEARAKPPFERRALCLGTRGGKVYAVGGMQPDGKVTTATAVYDPETDTWSDGPALPGDAMEGFGAACCTVNGQLYVSTFSGKLLRLADDGRSWQPAGKLQTGRFFHQLLPLANNQLAAIAGAHKEQGRFKDVEVVRLAD